MAKLTGKSHWNHVSTSDTNTFLFQLPPLWCELMHLGNAERQQMHFLVGDRSHLSSALLWRLTLRAVFFAAILDGMHHIITTNDLEGQVPKTGELPLATSGVLVVPISVWRGMGKGERKGVRRMKPLEHLVADLALNMILFLDLVQQEIYSHRKNEDCFFSFIVCCDKYASQGHLFFANKNVPYVHPSHIIFA